jgi:predicted alpha/beta-fold hydrolase
MNFQGGKIRVSTFKPFPVLKNQHVQTIWPAIIRRHPTVETQRERIKLDDGDFIDLDWKEKKDAPLIILLHGLASSSRAKYIKGLQSSLYRNGFGSVAINLRGCSGEPNLKSRSYHAGVSEDLDLVLSNLKNRFPGRSLGAVGFSLGGNVLLKWLSEAQCRSQLFAAVSVSAPLRLDLTTHRIQQGFSKVYEQYLLNFMKLQHHNKLSFFRDEVHGDESRFLNSLPSLWLIRNIADFDEHITAPLHGFRSAEDYHFTCSTKNKLKKIRTPTLVIHAKDDPFMPPEILPDEMELSHSVGVEVSEYGGHVGFLGINNYGLPEYWIEQRVPLFFQQQLRVQI